MKTIISSLVFAACMLFTVSAFSQPTGIPETISVYGYGVSKVSPDQLMLEIYLNDAYVDPGMNINSLEADLKALITKCGGDIRKLKMSNTQINPAIEGDPYSVRSEYRTYTLELNSKEAFDKFGTDIYNIFGASYVLKSYSVKDSAGIKEKAYAEAVKDAKDRADRMALAYGVKLGEVLIIEDQSGTVVDGSNSGMYFTEEYYTMDVSISFNANLKITYRLVR